MTPIVWRTVDDTVLAIARLVAADEKGCNQEDGDVDVDSVVGQGAIYLQCAVRVIGWRPRGVKS